jgi:hypothetical protein
MKRRKSEPRFVICIRNEDCEDLEPRKVYQVLPDEAAAVDGYLRVIDESGEDYLYPQSYFVPIELPQAAETALLSEQALAEDWNRPEEDEAWSHLQ